MLRYGGMTRITSPSSRGCAVGAKFHTPQIVWGQIHMKFSLRRICTVVAMTGLLASSAFVAAGPASAADDSSGLHSFGTEAQVPVNDYLPELIELSKIQTPEQIDAVLGTGTENAPVEGLINPMTGEVIAAFVPEPTMSTRAITSVGPGCTTSSFCMTTTGNIPLGYTGTGILLQSWSNIKKFSTGDQTAAIRTNDVFQKYAAWQAFTFMSATEITYLKRG